MTGTRHPLTRPPAAALVLLLLAARAPAQSAPAGWTVGHVGAGTVTYTPPDLAPDQVYTIAIFPRAPLRGKMLEERLQAALEKDAAQPGAGPPSAITRKGQVAVAGRVFMVNGQHLTVLYTEVLGAGETAQLQRVYYTPSLYDKYKAATIAVAREMVRALGRPPGEEHAPVTAPPGLPPGAGVKPSQVQGVYTEYVI